MTRLQLTPSVPSAVVAPAPRLSPSNPSSFADRLTAGRNVDPKRPMPDTLNAALDDDSLMQAELAALRERLEEYAQQVALMHSLMLNPGPSPTLDRE